MDILSAKSQQPRRLDSCRCPRVHRGGRCGPLALLGSTVSIIALKHVVDHELDDEDSSLERRRPDPYYWRSTSKGEVGEVATTDSGFLGDFGPQGCVRA